MSDEESPIHPDGLKQSTPRFSLPVASQPYTDAERSKPSFLKSDGSSNLAHDPLPEAFSPRRRGQPFVAGGMAAELQSWIVDVGSVNSQARQRQDNSFSVALTADMVRGDHGVVLLQGRDSQGAIVRAVLADKSASQAVLVPGQTVKIREPTWTIDVAGEEYLVGIDWQLSNE